MFWDEIVWLPLPFLDRLLVLAVEQDREAGMAALEYVSAHFRQGWAAQAALLELTARSLERCQQPKAIASAEDELVWLPDFLPADVAQVLPGFREVGAATRAALERTGRYYRQLGLDQARQRADNLVRALTFASPRIRQRFGPIAIQWRNVLSQEIQQLAAEAAREHEIPNPYNAGSPIFPGGPFVGRQDLCQRIETHLVGLYQKPPLLLYGQRRMGKTTLLRQLPVLLGPDHVPIYVNVQNAANVSSDSGLLYNLARAMRDQAKRWRKLEFPPLSLPELNTEPYIAFDEWLNGVEAALGQRTALLCLDEFEKIEERLRSGQLTVQVLDFLRDLIEQHPRLVVLFAGAHTLGELSARWASYFISVQVLKVSYLKEAEARQLITEPIEDFLLNYTPEAVDHIVAVTRCHPFLVQLICQELVNYLNELPPERRMRATVGDVEVACRRGLTSGVPLYFADIANTAYANEPEAAILAALARKGPGATMTAEALQAEIEADVAPALDRLCQRDLLELTEGGYRFQVELVRRWWEMNA